jgi:hypothetical protein
MRPFPGIIVRFQLTFADGETTFKNAAEMSCNKLGDELMAAVNLMALGKMGAELDPVPVKIVACFQWFDGPRVKNPRPDVETEIHITRPKRAAQKSYALSVQKIKVKDGKFSIGE